MPIISFNMDTVLETGFNVTTIIKETAFLSAGWNMAADGDGARSKGFVYGTVLGGIFQRTPQVVNTELYIASQGSVDATGDQSAIEIDNAFGHTIVNDGRIGGLAKVGIEFNHSNVGGPGTSSVTNTGTIRGVADGILGLSFAGSSPAIVNILNMGEISSPGDAIDISRGRVDNKGTIIGDIAFRLPGDSVLVNTGTILGDVLSAASLSNMLIDTRQGILIGKITTNGGADKIYGSVGDDTIVSGDGNDRINGHLGADDMDGGNGNDIYTIDHGGDLVTDSAGTDTIRSFISLDLTDGDTVKGTIELLRLMGEADLRAAGTDGTEQLQGNVGDNELLGAGGNDVLVGKGGDDTLFGEDGIDFINGGRGADVMAGGLGNDTYTVDSLRDTVDEESFGGAGIDTLVSFVSYRLENNARILGSVENLSLAGTASIDGSGNALANVVRGNSANNILNGRAGNDTLTGGDGKDTFVFDIAPGSEAGVDTITDFVIGLDKISLEDAAFAGLAGPVLSSLQFASGGPLAATEAAATIIHNKSTGDIFFDADGKGAGSAILFAKVTAGLVLSSTDFFVT